MKKVNIRNLFKIFVITSLSLFTFTSCGYKPTSTYAKKQIDGKIFVNVLIDLEEPEITVLLKDSINETFLKKLDANFVYNQNEADIIFNLKVSSISIKEISYDEDGYNDLYRATVNLNLSFYDKKINKRKSFSLSGDNSFSINDGASITDVERFDAIENALDNALDELLSKLAVSFFKK